MHGERERERIIKGLLVGERVPTRACGSATHWREARERRPRNTHKTGLSTHAFAKLTHLIFGVSPVKKHVRVHVCVSYQTKPLTIESLIRVLSSPVWTRSLSLCV